MHVRTIDECMGLLARCVHVRTIDPDSVAPILSQSHELHAVRIQTAEDRLGMDLRREVEEFATTLHVALSSMV